MSIYFHSVNSGPDSPLEDRIHGESWQCRNASTRKLTDKLPKVFTTLNHRRFVGVANRNEFQKVVDFISILGMGFPWAIEWSTMIRCLARCLVERRQSRFSRVRSTHKYCAGFNDTISMGMTPFWKMPIRVKETAKECTTIATVQFLQPNLHFANGNVAFLQSPPIPSMRS